MSIKLYTELSLVREYSAVAREGSRLLIELVKGPLKPFYLLKKLQKFT